ncbi:anthranilate synthase [Nonlabens sp. MIC269]|uniref:anthranilate synthase component I family protein n=1 Tax=Nonlabens sp. MIC269 TaxID=1476901 RepID=UPI0007201BAC|nr:anthranilate synthase component I family protein [Nonlabens sp. MIC269]ALM20505.1 anthranilate synthase [Nonlabens sp. MIC269]
MNKIFKAKTTHREILADTLTPVSIYLRLRDKYPNSILLESNEYGQRNNSYSFICCNPIASFELTNEEEISVFPDGKKSVIDLKKEYRLTSCLENFKNHFEQQDHKFAFPIEGLYGYLSYDAVQHFENIEFRFRESENIPLAYYQVFQNVIVFDHFHNQLYVFDHVYENYISRLDEVCSIITHRDIATYNYYNTGEENSEMNDQSFKELVKQGKAHCKRGDVFQIVLSRKFKQSFKGDDFQVYRQLRAINPSPYLFYFDYGNFRIFGSSPEAQLIVKNDYASIQPIAGTYKRTGNDTADYEAAQNLKNDPKETAEHVMLVDLARNDLSRHARNVQVQDYQSIHFYSHVIHMVSKVTGKILDEKDRLELVGDTFPAGTLSGAPKYNAMQLIDKYEKSNREFYGGAIGYLGFDGNFNHAIIIRSILSRNNQLEFRAGAGVVIESNIEDETQEVYNKTNALRKAIKLANHEK